MRIEEAVRLTLVGAAVSMDLSRGQQKAACRDQHEEGFGVPMSVRGPLTETLPKALITALGMTQRRMSCGVLSWTGP